MSVFSKGWYQHLRQRASVYSQSVTQSLEVGKTKNQIRVLDGLRAIACLAVLSYHLNLLARNYNLWAPKQGFNDIIAIVIYFGESGVTLFFLLSGFLLFLPFAKSLLFDSPWPAPLRFYLRRVFRIVPGYYAALFLMILFFHPEFFRPAYWQDLWLFMTFRIEPTPAQAINGPFWTLTIEFQFYLLLPIIAWLCSLVVRRGTLHQRMLKLTLCLLALLGWGLVTKYWGMYAANSSTLDFLMPHNVSTNLKPYIYGQTGKYFEVFAVGMLLCMLYTYTQNAPAGDYWKERLHRWSLPLFGLGLLILLFLSFWHYYYININIYTYKNLNQVFTFLDPYIPQFLNYWTQWQAFSYALCYGLCMCALLYGSSRLKAPFEWPPLRWIGMISFSLYMWHLPFLFLFVDFVVHRLQSQGFSSVLGYFAFCCWALFVIFPLSLTFYRWIEMPGMRLGESVIKRVEAARKPPEPLAKPRDEQPVGVATRETAVEDTARDERSEASEGEPASQKW